MSVLKKSELVFTPHPVRKIFIDRTGVSSNRLRVLGYAGTSGNGKKKYHCWYTECTCGSVQVQRGNSVASGRIKSCGCLQREKAGKEKKMRGIASGRYDTTGKKTSEYAIYRAAKDRCNLTTNKRFKNYGGRGISFGFKSFEQFLAVMGMRPSKHHSIDRINVNGDYTPQNCRWTTNKEQCRNMRKNKIVTVDGIDCKLINFFISAESASYARVTTRISRGWPVKAAIFALPYRPNGKKMLRSYAIEYVKGKSLQQLATAAGLNVPPAINAASNPRGIERKQDAA